MAGGGAHRRIAVRVYVTIRFGRLCRGSAYHAQMGGWVAHAGNAIRVHAAPCADGTARGFRHALIAGGATHRGAGVWICAIARAGGLRRGSAYHAQMGGWVAHPGNAIRVHAARCAHMAGCLRQRGPTTAGYCAYNANGRDDDCDEESPLPTGHACRSDPGMQALKVC